MKTTPIYPWRELSKHLTFKSRVVDVYQSHRIEESPEQPQAEGNYIILDAPEWVNMVVLTPEMDLVLIEQWRHGVERTTLEIPGGMVDPGESPLEAAQRELEEETGYTSSHWQKIGAIDPNPALQSNRCHTYLATNGVRSSTPSFDSNERCKLVLKPYKEADDMVKNGEISHALVVVALYFARLALVHQTV